MSTTDSLVSSQQSDAEAYYLRLHATCGDVMKQSLANASASQHYLNHSFINDFEKWADILANRPECVLLKAALREYQFALLAVLFGQYSQAFMALRLFLELALAAIFFSANELQLRVWARGERDINWHQLIDTDNGVLSKYFVQVFFSSVADDASHYRAIAQHLYRECSEYAHGNINTRFVLPENLEFVESEFADFQQKAKSACLVISFALTFRYWFDLSKDQRNELEPIILDQLGHVEAVRAVLAQE
jgi:hypothetical protein